MLTTSHDQPAPEECTPSINSCGVKSGPDSNRRTVASPRAPALWDYCARVGDAVPPGVHGSRVMRGRFSTARVGS